LLLVLDNFEHVLGAAPLLAELLAAAPRLRLLVTSQLPLRLSEEHTFVLEGLTERSAVELLLARAKQTSRGLVIVASGEMALAALCRELDGSPLGIELAAARLRLLSPDELLERLRRSPDALGTGGQNLPERHRGLRATMQWSHGLLDPQADAVFRRLGHFAGERTLERIEQVCGAGSSPRRGARRRLAADLGVCDTLSGEGGRPPRAERLLGRCDGRPDQSRP
jgi:predicted ATPase